MQTCLEVVTDRDDSEVVGSVLLGKVIEFGHNGREIPGCSSHPRMFEETKLLGGELVTRCFLWRDDALAFFVPRHLNPTQTQTRGMPFRTFLAIGTHDLDGDMDLWLCTFAGGSKMPTVVFDDGWTLCGLAEKMRKTEGQASTGGEFRRVDSRAEQPDLGHALRSRTRAKLLERMPVGQAVAEEADQIVDLLGIGAHVDRRCRIREGRSGPRVSSGRAPQSQIDASGKL